MVYICVKKKKKQHTKQTNKRLQNLTARAESLRKTHQSNHSHSNSHRVNECMDTWQKCGAEVWNVPWHLTGWPNVSPGIFRHLQLYIWFRPFHELGSYPHLSQSYPQAASFLPLIAANGGGQQLGDQVIAQQLTITSEILKFKLWELLQKPCYMLFVSVKMLPCFILLTYCTMRFCFQIGTNIILLLRESHMFLCNTSMISCLSLLLFKHYCFPYFLLSHLQPEIRTVQNKYALQVLGGKQWLLLKAKRCICQWLAKRNTQDIISTTYIANIRRQQRTTRFTTPGYVIKIFQQSIHARNHKSKPKLQCSVVEIY